MQETLQFAIHLARQTGTLLCEHLDRTAAARLKADKSVVTEADMAADRMIAEKIQEEFPGEYILSEELQPHLSWQAPERMWVIDPLDGTTNYSLGLPFWGVSIARLVSGQPDLGVLYFPLLDELYHAQRGDGAALNGSPLLVESTASDLPVSFFACCSRTYRDYEIKIRFKPRILGSAAYSLCSIARGIAVLAFEATPKIWDIAAGWLLVTEAGGVIETYDGSQPFPVAESTDYSRSHFPTLAAANPKVLADARRKIILKTKPNNDHE